MGTRSTIALEFADGTVQQVYCHWDGYLSHNGQLLLQYYSNPFILRDLIDLGDVSSLGKLIGTKHPFSQFEINKDAPDYDQLIALHELADKEGWTTFYGRDRGETGTSARKFKDYKDYRDNAQFEEYNYILRQVDGKPQWFVEFYGEFDGKLEQAIADEQDRIAQEETA
jgi:hypothetical protein